MRAPAGSAPLTVALAALALLAALAHVLEPPHVRVADVPAHEGDGVTVAGRVTGVRAGERGWAATLVDATGRLTLLGRGDGAPAAGDDVRARGVVNLDADGYVLSVDRLTVDAPAPGRPRAVGEVARDPARFVGAPVAVAGVLRDGLLRDPAGGAGVAVDLPPQVAADGSVGVAEGTLRYRPSEAAYRLDATRWRPR